VIYHARVGGQVAGEESTNDLWPSPSGVSKKSDGVKSGIQGVAIGGPQLAVGVLDMNWSLPQPAAGG